MSTTTLKIRAVPESYASVVITQTSVASFGFSRWVVVAPIVNSEMYILGFDYTTNTVLTADSTHELLFEVGFGKPGYEETRVQLPYSVRSDTSVGYYLPSRIFLPEPIFVPKLTTVSVRVADNRAGIDSYSGVRLMVMGDVLPVQQREQINIQNQHSIRVGSGMSVSERGGVF